jgi:hypothetical protein
MDWHLVVRQGLQLFREVRGLHIWYKTGKGFGIDESVDIDKGPFSIAYPPKTI